MNVSDFLVNRLYEWGVRRIFSYPGEGINEITSAIDRAKDSIEYVQVRHEEMAAFMACGHAKFTGEVGVCLASSGPGAIQLLNGLYDAKMDHQPVVAIIGQQPRSSLGGSFMQEVDLLSLFKDVASEYIHMACDASQMRHLTDRAMRIAQAERTVTCIIVPSDIQEMKAVEVPPHAHGTIHSGIGFSQPRIIPSGDDLKRAAEILNDGKKVAMLIGVGAKNAEEEVTEVAELLGAGVAKALLGRSVLSDDLPFVTGSIGLLGTRPSYEMMEQCDTLLMIGSGFPYAEFLPKEGQARGIQIDIDGRMLGFRYPMEVNLIGDSKETLKELIPFLQYKKDREWREQIEDSIKNWWGVLEERAMQSADPVNPQRVFWECSSRLPDNCIITTDSGSVANWFARDLKLRRGMMASLSGNLATMCPGVPYAIAAKFAYPNRIPIAFVGDGAMQMGGNNELITIAKYWRKWEDPRLIIVVLNNRDLNHVTWEQRVLSGNPKFDASQDLPDFPYAKYAELIGLRGFRIDNPEEIGPALDHALSSDIPVVFEVITDPNVPPLPPHISFEQARAYISSLAKGDTEAVGVIKQTMKETIA